MPTYYDLLGVDPGASTDEIEAAYRDRLKQEHPDVSDESDAGDRTKALIEARDVLTDESERSQYDQLGHDQYCRLNDTVVEPTARATDDVGAGSRGGSATSGGGSAPGSTASRTESSTTSTATGATSTTTGGSTAGHRTEGTGTRTGESQASASSSTRQSGMGADWNQSQNRERGGTRARSDERTDKNWRVWDTEGSYNVTPDDDRVRGNRLFPFGPSLIVLGTAFFVYPIMLGAALLPEFPLVVNVIVGLCVVFLVVFLQSMPAVGVVVFGAWTVLLPIVMVSLGVDIFSLVGIIALSGTVFPLGLSALTWVALR